MIRMQSIKTPAGEELVVLPRADFDRLLTAAEALAAVAKAQEVIGRISRGEEETFPHELVKRLRKGEDHPIRIFREYRGLTQAKLAAAAGINPQYVWQLEHGRAKGGDKTLRRLAQVLVVAPDLLRPKAVRT